MVEIIFENTDPHLIDKKIFKNITTHLINEENVDFNIEIGLTFVSKEEMKEINRINRNIDEPTDIISLPLFSGKEDLGEFSGYSESILLGDIFMCLEKIKDDAAEDGLVFNDYILEVYCHGLLHLLGYEHDNDDKYKKMIDLQRKYARSS